MTEKEKQEIIELVHKTLHDFCEPFPEGELGARPLTLTEKTLLEVNKVLCEKIQEMPTVERLHGEWEALGFQQGYAFCRCSNCHKTMRLYRDSKNEFCCIADIRKKVVSCMYCGADMRKEGEQE